MNLPIKLATKRRQQATAFVCLAVCFAATSILAARAFRVRKAPHSERAKDAFDLCEQASRRLEAALTRKLHRQAS